MFAAEMAWPSAVVSIAFVLGLFVFLGRGAGGRNKGYWQYRAAKETA